MSGFPCQTTDVELKTLFM